jgi:ABC-type antimicrobial peptide transport system permease subunit
MYVQLTPGSSAASLEAKISRYLRDQGPDVKYTLSLQPLAKIHLHSADFTLFGLGNFQRSDIRQVALFLTVALVVLLMACVNYMNLSTARSLKRAREIGVRRVNGAGRGDIIRQFLGESFLFAFVALAAAVALAAVAFPALQAISGRRLDLGLLPKGQILLSLAGVFLFTGFASGIYPAFLMSRFAPVLALKQTVKSGGGPFLNIRRVLVVAQVVCSVGLVITTAVFGFQVRYLLTKDLGFDRRNVLLVGFRGEWEQMPSFKEELLRFPGITGVTYGLEPAMGTQGHAIGSSDIDWEGRPDDARVSFDFLFADEDYLQTFGLPLAEGRFFAKGFAADKDNFVLNETAVRAIGLAEPVGKAFRLGKRTGRIIGVVKDFHTSNLRAAIKPTLFLNSRFGGLSIRFDPNRTRDVIGHLETAWKKFVPEHPLEYTFLEDDLEAMYRDERTTGRIVTIFGLLSLVIAGLGLFGLVSLASEQKTKEIGIRKVLGATIMDIVRFMSREFAILVGAAIVLAWPIGYVIGSRWLSGFAYRIPLSWWIFAGSGAVVFVVAFLAMGWRSVRAATADPVRSLRWE